MLFDQGEEREREIMFDRFFNFYFVLDLEDSRKCIRVPPFLCRITCLGRFISLWAVVCSPVGGAVFSIVIVNVNELPCSLTI